MSLRGPTGGALRHRDFRVFWTGALASAIGNELTSVAMLWQVYLLTNSPLDVGVLGLARALPQIALSLVGGLLADAIDRRRLLLISQLVQCAISLGLVISTLTGAISPVTLYIAAALLALTSALEFPARQAFIPNLVPGSELSSALAFTITQRSIAAMAGPAAAGIVLALGGPAWCYGVDAASSSAMLLALLLIPRRPQVLGGRLGVSAAALRDGLRFVAGSRVILSLMVLDFGATFFGSPRALIPVYARDILDVGAAGLGLLYASISAGALVAGLVMAVVPTRAKAGLWVVLGVIVYAIGTMLFAISEVFWLSLLMLALSGAGNTLSAVLRGTINQTLTPDALRGRVSAVNSVFVNGGPQLGQFESGVVAALWDAKVSAFSGGLGALLVALAIAVVPNVRAFQLTEMRLPEPATTRV